MNIRIKMTYMHTCIHACMHTYIHTYIYQYTHAHIKHADFQTSDAGLHACIISVCICVQSHASMCAFMLSHTIYRSMYSCMYA